MKPPTRARRRPQTKALGATTQDANIAQIFTLMENGTVKGYGWPVLGHQPGWETVTKYRVDPGFYDVDLMILANMQRWGELSEDAQKLIKDAAMALEQDAIANDAKLNKEVAAKQVESGFEIIEFADDDQETWLNTARQAGWDGPIVALTAHVMADDREKCLEAGCDDYLSKPVRRADLIDTVARHLKPADVPAPFPSVISGSTVVSATVPTDGCSSR